MPSPLLLTKVEVATLERKFYCLEKSKFLTFIYLTRTEHLPDSRHGYSNWCSYNLEKIKGLVLTI